MEVNTFPGWTKVAPGIYTNGAEGEHLMVAVGRCCEFSDVRAQYVVTFWVVSDFDFSGKQYRWIPDLETWTPTRIRQAPTSSDPVNNVSLQVASESSFNRCMLLRTTWNRNNPMLAQMGLSPCDRPQQATAGPKDPQAAQDGGTGTTTGYLTTKGMRNALIIIGILAAAALTWILTRE